MAGNLLKPRNRDARDYTHTAVGPTGGLPRGRAFPCLCSLCSVWLLLSGSVNFALADGAGAYGKRLRSSETAQETRVRDIYDAGVALITEAEAQKTEADARSSYERALARLSEAARLEPTFYEAHTYLGYLNRKLGHHARALEAYEAALRLKPDYVPAIEYQGEAYLGLDRFEEARFNYLRLYATAPGQADKLLDAMQSWVAAKKKDRGKFTAEDIAAFDDWVSQRIAARIVTGRAKPAAWDDKTE